MIVIPFSSTTFASEFKPKLSGANVTLDYSNMESSLMKVAPNMQSLIGDSLYSKLCDVYKTPIQDDTLYSTCLDYMQRAMLHFAMYEHLIFFMIRIGNDGVTTKKNNDETTIFKYQEDKLNNSLISTAWFWSNQLLKFLQTNAASILEWQNSDAQQNYNALPVHEDDFTKWAGITDMYFIFRAKWIIQEVWLDNIPARNLTDEMLNSLQPEISRAVVYSVLQFACLRMAFGELPEGIRKDISSELLKKNSDYEETYIREKVSVQFAKKAESYWNMVDMAIKAAKIKAATATTDSNPTYHRPRISDEDSFFFGG